jgi:hypothetical protein
MLLVPTNARAVVQALELVSDDVEVVARWKAVERIGEAQQLGS